MAIASTSLSRPAATRWSSRSRRFGPEGGWFDRGAAEREAVLRRLDRLSWLLDVAFVIPGTNIRFGIDAIVGLIPGIGDGLGGLLSCIILVEAARLGAPLRLLARMAFNVAVEVGVGTVPIAGDLFDVMWRANRRNMRLLRQHFGAEGAV